ncbi:hypothetical protein BDV93DRAFT_530078 [Ceratobasidium sp. AG-I]|nr:hypothetical protein BDV93DRAFT_530078 [Ceratobasidium sp. AG-I]
MVLMETGVPVHGLRTYADVWTALEGGVEGLYTLHQQGFVHRDINSGNILLIGAGLEKRGVIVDLEYAKGVHDKPAPHDAKKGTAAFMAIQVQQLEYTHIPPPKPEFSDELDPPGFRQNALHDLESVWWLSLWVLFYLVRPDEPKLPDYHWNFSRVFGRAQLWHSDGRYHKCSSHFPDGSKFRHIMNMWAYQTKGYYAESYASGNYVVIDIDLINKAYRTQKETLQSLRDDTQSYPLKLKCLADFDRVSSELAAPPATTRKRLN